MTPRDDALCKTVLDESARFRDMMAQSRSRADGIFKLRDTIELFVSKCAPPPPPPPPLGAPKIMPLLAPPPAAPDDNTLCATMLAEFARLRDIAAMTSVLPLNEKALARALERTTTTKTTTSVIVRRRLAACPTFLEASHADLQGRGGGLEDGVNYVSASCDMDSSSESSLTVSSGQTYKIAKHPSAAAGEEVVLDRKATKQDLGRHFKVSGGNLEVTGLTLTGGYGVSVRCVLLDSEFMLGFFYHAFLLGEFCVAAFVVLIILVLFDSPHCSFQRVLTKSFFSIGQF